MIDIHTHILAGIDDGPKNWEGALKLAKLSVQNGIDTVVATPHYQYRNSLNDREKVLKKVGHFQELLWDRGIPLKVFAGTEVMISGYRSDAVRSEQFTTINNTGKYILVEIPTSSIPANLEETIHDFRVKGYYPIVAHPERNSRIMADPNVVIKLIEAGALIQVNASSLTGMSGYRTMRTAETLLMHNMVHFLGSDMHCFETRAPDMARARRKAEKLIGCPEVQRLVRDNPEKVLEAEDIHIEQPERYRKFVGMIRYSGKMLMCQIRENHFFGFGGSRV